MASITAAGRRDLSGPAMLHYESRALRDELRASGSRLLSARSHAPPGLTPQQGSAMVADWQTLSLHPSIDQDSNVASGNPHYEEMRAALFEFEADHHCEAPAKERAFYSALRTLLQESIDEKTASVRDTKLAAANRWFNKNRPYGGWDKDLAAVLSASLSVVPLASTSEALGRHYPAEPPSPGSERLRHLLGGKGGGGGAPEKHKLHTAYSRDSVAAAGGTTGGTTWRDSRRDNVPPTGQRPPTLGAAARQPHLGEVSFGGPAGEGLTASGSPRSRARPFADALPFMLRPSSPSSRTTRPSPAESAAVLAAAATASMRAAGLVPPQQYSSSSSAGAASDAQSDRASAVGDLTTAYAPIAMARGAGLPQNGSGTGGHVREPMPPDSPRTAAQASGGSTTTSWRPSFRLDGKAAPLVGGGGSGGSPLGSPTRHPRTPGSAESRAADVAAIRAQWRSMDVLVGASDVTDKVDRWSVQRSRLEEEIVRRQEATAYVSTALRRGAAANTLADTAPVDGSNAWRSELSAYGNLLPIEPGHYPPPGVGSPIPSGMLQRAYSARAQARMEYEQEAQAIRARMAAASLHASSTSVAAADGGSGGGGDGGGAAAMMTVASASALENALMPVPDRPFVEIVVKLPQPGTHLVSRPGSAGPTVEKKKKKKRLPSAKKKRLDSAGRR